MDIKKILRQFNLSFRDRLSQNFLRSEKIAERIADCAGIAERDVVLEIGTGLGILTETLQKRSEKVITFEPDQNLIPHLPFIFQMNPETEVIAADFLKYDLEDLRRRFEQIKIVANLPFHISTEIMFKLFKYHHWIESMTLMFQKEVARRIAAGPGSREYGILSVLSRLYSEPKICFSVAPVCFYPIPRVYASVVHFKMKKKMIINEEYEEIFIRVVKTAFGQRRKTLLNALSKIAPSAALKKACDVAGIDLKRRAETLSLEEFKALTEIIVRI